MYTEQGRDIRDANIMLHSSDSGNLLNVCSHVLSSLMSRRYRHGARLALHVDKLSTHVISFIINIDQVSIKGCK